jgi:Xaa-Pro dipeptidase
LKTPRELERIRAACYAAGLAFEHGAAGLRPGLAEAEAAHLFAGPLSVQGLGWPGVSRAAGFVFCMSGPNSAEAGAAFARTRARTLARGDLVLTHCNSYVDGYWTDITRTYCLAPAEARQGKMYAAVLAARSAALVAIRPGAPAAGVDGAARAVLTEHGFGAGFPHSVGHGVGFGAIDHDAHPRLHPAAQEVLEEGMVFNVRAGHLHPRLRRPTPLRHGGGNPGGGRNPHALPSPTGGSEPQWDTGRGRE